jgi:hypothetical protein
LKGICILKKKRRREKMISKENSKRLMSRWDLWMKIKNSRI